jgi:hypothetical protein
MKKGSTKSAKSLISLAGTTGLEPATSGVTGRRSNQAELRPHIIEYRRLNIELLNSIFLNLQSSIKVVGGTGFEPATPGL